MKFTDKYTSEDVETLNLLAFLTSMAMLALAIIAKVVGIL